MPGAGKVALGFIGVGKMGAPMAENLLKAGYKLFVCDRSADAVAHLTKLGAKAADTPASLGTISGLRAVFSMLPTPQHVRDAYLGPQGLLTAEPGTLQAPLLIDSSTIDPGTAKEVAAAAESTMLHADPADAFSRFNPAMIDAPVSGGTPGAVGATLCFMAGGDADAVRQAEPFLLKMGKRVVHCGEHGSGQAAKLANNLSLAIQMAAVAEGLAFGARLGLDPAVLTGIFNASSAHCWSSEKNNPVPGVMDGVPAARGYAGGFSTALMLKDLRLALESAGPLDARLPMTARACELYAEAADTAGTTSLDFSAIYEYVYNRERR